MDVRYRGTVVEKLVPLIGKSATAVLKKHGVTKEQYALWLYRRAYNHTGAQAAMVIILCIALLAALIAALMENAGATLTGHMVIQLVAIAGVIGLILALTAWTMRHNTHILRQYMTTEGFLHKLTADYVQDISRRTWKTIADFEPDLDRFRISKAIHRKLPALTLAQQERIAALRPWRRAAGWAAIGTLALFFFVGENGLTVVSAVAMATIGTWLTLRALQMYIAGQIVDHYNGLATHGKPAKMVAVIYGLCSLGLLAAGVAGIVVTSIA